ncbi:hypothetical protein VNO77_17954 [Canavalia gladiata]|uniref:Uncharacterized protein n=1 Tax=Canavalia gladiata TaxID=3824 RepID=A0AAN9QJ62_CANGL
MFLHLQLVFCTAQTDLKAIAYKKMLIVIVNFTHMARALILRVRLIASSVDMSDDRSLTIDVVALVNYLTHGTTL